MTFFVPKVRERNAPPRMTSLYKTRRFRWMQKKIHGYVLPNNKTNFEIISQENKNFYVQLFLELRKESC